MEYIRITDQGWPPDHARSAYDSGHFVEAIQVLHGWLECQCRGLLFMVGHSYFGTKGEHTWDVADQISFKDTVKCLYVLGQVSKEEYDSLLALNTVRNKIIHQLFNDPWEKEFKGIPKKQYDDVFRKVESFCNLIESKSEAMSGQLSKNTEQSPAGDVMKSAPEE